MVQFLDCTLRDGAHVNGGRFGNANIKQIARELTRANVDIVELGFLRNVVYDGDVSFYPKIEMAYDVLEKIAPNRSTEYALMARADEYDLNNLSECNGQINYVRVAFYYEYLDKAVEFASEVAARGYKITLNLINTPGNSLDDIKRLVEHANRILPAVVTIVDTFGVLSIPELSTILDEYDGNLDLRIKIGLHVHENLALAFSLAKSFIDYVRPERNIIVDGSLMGMGRIPGNLCTELIADYLNSRLDKNYELPSILRLIENIIAPIKKQIPWGYSPAYFLSAKYRIHRSYAEYLIEKNIPLDKINFILSRVDREHAGKFYRDYASELIERDAQNA